MWHASIPKIDKNSQYFFPCDIIADVYFGDFISVIIAVVVKFGSAVWLLAARNSEHTAHPAELYESMSIFRNEIRTIWIRNMDV